MQNFTSTLVVMSHKINACSMSASQANLCAAGVSMAPCKCNQLNAKDTDMEQALLSRYITTKLMVKWRVGTQI